MRHLLGMDGGSLYDLYSGLVPAVTVPTGFFLYLRRVNCDVDGCVRFGRTDKRGVTLCRQHAHTHAP